MADKKKPACFAEPRAREIVLGGTVPNTTASLQLQRNPIAPVRIVGWQVDRWLGVSRLEVCHDH